MCGITGYIEKSISVNTDILASMNATLRHRGPDSQGIFGRKNFGVASSRLAIIDVKHGAQPMSNEKDTVHVVFNGEIYNYQELKLLLENSGHKFQTNSDTETVLRSYLEWGEEFVRQLNGMFSIAIVDERKQQLLLYRDRLGIKPLFYQAELSRFLFGSEMKAIFAHPQAVAGVFEAEIAQYLMHRYIPNPGTIYRNVQQLAPGSFLVVSLNDGQIINHQRYWDLTIGEQAFSSYEEACFELRHTLEQAVTRRMVSEVPLGAFLSGGIDCSIAIPPY